MSEQKNTPNNIQLAVIIVLLVVIAIMGFFLGKSSNTDSNSTNENGTQAETNYEELSIVVIDDARCTNCPTDAIIEQLQLLPSVASANLVKKDFSDA